jgi:hypothetical protein
VPGHKGIEGNEIAGQLVRRGSMHPFIGPEPACGISGRVAGHAIRDGVQGTPKIMAIHLKTKTRKGLLS